MTSPPVGMQLRLLRPLWTGERDTIDALAVALGTALERARLDTEAREQRVQADIVRARAAFLATVTHDLRTPLATIKTATGALLMSDEVLPADERHELTSAAHDEVDRLIRIVDKTLELSRIRAGAVVTETVELTPADLVRLATERLSPTLDVGLVRLDIDPEVPAVAVDPLLMEHALRNLLENALVHGPAGTEVVVERAGHRRSRRVAGDRPRPRNRRRRPRAGVRGVRPAGRAHRRRGYRARSRGRARAHRGPRGYRRLRGDTGRRRDLRGRAPPHRRRRRPPTDTPTGRTQEHA